MATFAFDRTGVPRTLTIGRHGASNVDRGGSADW